MTRIPRGATQFKWRRQRQEKARRWPTLNLVALMDVFTILVFFFLVHSANDTWQEQSELVRLPESITDVQPRETPIVTITFIFLLSSPSDLMNVSELWWIAS